MKTQTEVIPLASAATQGCSDGDGTPELWSKEQAKHDGQIRPSNLCRTLFVWVLIIVVGSGSMMLISDRVFRGKKKKAYRVSTRGDRFASARSIPIRVTQDHEDARGRNSGGVADSITTSSTTTKTYFVTEFGQKQVESYRSDEGIILNIHILHHGGETVLSRVGRAVGAPSLACMTMSDDVEPSSESSGCIVGNNSITKDYPWGRNETESRIQMIRPFYRMVSWQLGGSHHHPMKRRRPLADTDWENPHLVSVIVMKHPLSLVLAEDGYVSSHYPGISEGTANETEWWAFSKDARNDNFDLHQLVDDYDSSGGSGDCGNGGENMSVTLHQIIESAKALVSRMTFVLDIECLDEGLEAMADILGLTLNRSHRRHHPPPDKHYPYKAVYNYLERMNKLGIELYEWSKAQSLVKCDDLPHR